jgi:hypothetical protein
VEECQAQGGGWVPPYWWVGVTGVRRCRSSPPCLARIPEESRLGLHWGEDGWALCQQPPIRRASKRFSVYIGFLEETN